ncbi:acyl-CoA dehydrogenase family protein [Brevibacterium salitolerans]|uniref:Dibenzothiophene monooxygenase n=2 Tax=Brevibacterium TaxID=1696 RepID=A0ABN2X1F3_9MICO
MTTTAPPAAPGTAPGTASAGTASRAASSPTTADLLDRFSELFARIRAGAAERDRTRTLPRAEITALAEAGFGRLRLPVEHGGLGADLPQTFAVLTELAAADSNLAQIWRGHLAFVEDVLTARSPEFRARWLPRLASGAVVGNAWTEPGEGARGIASTTVSAAESGGARVNGTKFYTTGSIFADYADTTVTAPDGTQSIALVPLRQGGVTLTDDWDGFGQRTTGTGTAVFADAEVPAEDVYPFAERFTYQTALYQVVLLAAQAGIARAALRDASALVRDRTRSYSHGNAERAAEDPQLLEVVGHLAAAAQTAEVLTADAAQALQRIHEAENGDPTVRDRLGEAAELASARAQVVVSQLVPAAATRLFDALGASAVREGAALDRHWRNARTVASHNPWVYKARIAGEHAVHGHVRTDTTWSVGVASR